jgi:hypothetical protein
VATGTVYQWHNLVHQTRENARLHFWRFTFVPDYDRDKIMGSLEAAFSGYSVTSFAAYEVFGTEDLLVRLWLPRDHDPEDVNATFYEALRQHALDRSDYLVVRDTPMDTTWSHGQDPPDEAALARISNDHVRELDDFNQTVMSDPDANVALPNWVEQFTRLGLLISQSLVRKGMKFFVTFNHPRRNLNRHEREHVVSRIIERCELVARETQAKFEELHPPELAVYAGLGPETDLLIMARAPDTHFYSYARDLTFGLRGLNLHGLYSMRTYTHVIADRAEFRYVELPLTSNRQHVSLDVLDLSESANLEFKATYSVDLRRYLHNNEKHSNPKLTDAIVKSVCALLNESHGGTLIIGALEVSRELDRSGDRAPELRRQLENLFPFREGHGVGNVKAILGVEFEYDVVRNIKDWDTFSRNFEDLIRNTIRPYCLPLIDLYPVPYDDKRTLVAITVAESDTDWFYAEVDGQSHFYVREVSSTLAYDGPEGDIFRHANPRRRPS